MSELGAAPFLVLLAAAVTSSLVIAALYQHFFASTATGSQLYRAFSLLGLALAAIFITVQFSLPLSFGLLAALSIVRFRTPIKEPEEVGILMVVVAGAVASATFKLQFLGLLLATTFAALLIQRRLLAGRTAGGRRLVTVAMPAAAYRDSRPAVGAVVARHLAHGRIEGLVTRPDEVVVSYSVPAGARLDVESLRRELSGASVSPLVIVHAPRVRP